MLRRMMNRLSKGKKNRSQSERRGFQNQRGRFEMLEDRRMLSVNVISSVQVGTAGFEQFEDLFAAGSGNVLATGWSTGALYGSSAGTLDAVVGNYSASGSPIWTRQFGTTDQDVGHGVVSDASGNVYVTGSTDGSLGGAFLGIRDIFIRKYDSSGNHAWTKQIGTSGHDTGYDIAVDSSGNIYVTGIVSGNFGGTLYGLVDFFVTKYNSSGTVQWTTQLGSASDDYANSISIDASGNVYVGGYTKGALIGTNAGGTDAFITKLNGSGSQLWVKQFGASTNDSCEAVAVDSSGNLLASGRSTGVAFISKYNSSGTQLWSNTINVPITSNIRPYGVSVDLGDNVYVGGTLIGVFNGSISEDAFVAKYSSAGSALWTKIVATTSDEDGLALSVNALGNIYVGGETGGSLAATQLGNGDAFFSRIQESIFSLNTTADTADANPGDGVAVDSSGNTSLRAAIQEANALGDAVINLPSGIYNLTITGSGGDSQGDLEITGDITIVGAGAGATIINASGLGGDRVFEVTSTGNLGLSKLTVTGGSGLYTGGGILAAGDLTLDEVAVTGNWATGLGAGIYQASNVQTIIRNSVIATNHIYNSSHGEKRAGAGIFMNNGTITISNTIVANNTADSVSGTNAAADFFGYSSIVTSLGNNLSEQISSSLQPAYTLGNDSYGTVAHLVVTSVVDDVNMTNNSVAYSLREAITDANVAGGIVWLPAWRHRLTRKGTEGTEEAYNDLDIKKNVTLKGVGAGLSIVDGDAASSAADYRVFDIKNDGTLNASQITITGGKTTQNGGGVLVRTGGAAVLDEAAIVNNSAVEGGGIKLEAGASGDVTSLTVTSSTFTNNTATTRGGAIDANNTNTYNSITVGSTVFGKNVNAGGNTNLYVTGTGTKTNLGKNLVDNSAGHNGFFVTTGPNADYVNADANLVIVTSLADVIESTNDGFALTLREAVLASNASSPDENIWLAPWIYRLLIEGTGGAESGDLDIADTLAIRGTSYGGQQSLADSLSIIDSAFDNLGLLTLTNVSTS
jgi:CSLREA domain-containing protein